MYEVKTAVILAAGESSRMAGFNRGIHKSLLPYKGYPILFRLIDQLVSFGVKEVIVVGGCNFEYFKKILNTHRYSKYIVLINNKNYSKDKNILSVLLGVSGITNPYVIFEADTIMEDNMVGYIVGSDFEGKSVWFTRSKFLDGQYGTVILSDNNYLVSKAEYVSKFSSRYKNYNKWTGILRVGPNEIEVYKNLLTKRSFVNIKEYYWEVWSENLNLLKSYDGICHEYKFDTFNTKDEYLHSIEKDYDYPIIKKEVKLIPTSKLKHLEDYSKSRVVLLKKKILNDQVWKVPIIVETSSNIVLDGQHRLEVAKLLGLKLIPSYTYKFGEFSYWNFKSKKSYSPGDIVNIVNRGENFGFKSIKHNFPYNVGSVCNYSLDQLK